MSWQKFKTYSKSICSAKIWSEFSDSSSKQENNLVVASIWSSWNSSLTYMANTKKMKTYKNKNSVASSHVNTSNEAFRSVWNTVHSFTLRMRRFWLFVFCSNTDFTGQGKTLKGLHMCFNFSASNGGRKSHQCLFSLKSFLYKKESNQTKLEWFLIPFYSTFHWLFPHRFPSAWIRWLPIGSLDLTWALYNTDKLPHPQLTVFCHVSTSPPPLSPWDFLFLGSRAQKQSWPRGWSGTH